MKILIFSLLICSLFLTACSSNKLKLGTYEFENSKVKCDIELLGDSSFHQTVWLKKTGAIIKLKGNWNQVEKSITMSPFYYLIDPNTGEQVDEPIRLETADGEGRGDAIVFNELSHFWFNLK
jgi:hypothetical protein